MSNTLIKLMKDYSIKYETIKNSPISTINRKKIAIKQFTMFPQIQKQNSEKKNYMKQKLKANSKPRNYEEIKRKVLSLSVPQSHNERKYSKQINYPKRQNKFFISKEKQRQTIESFSIEPWEIKFI